MGATLGEVTAPARPLAPFPRSDANLPPGDSCQATLGPQAGPVNTAVWTVLCTTWGDRGVSLWRTGADTCEFPAAQERLAAVDLA
jgi:hypothetical protein